MASGAVPARAIRAKARSKAAQNTSTNNKWKKTIRVSPGDVIQFRSNNNHMLGSVGVVVGYLKKHTFLVRTFGGADSDYGPMYISITDRQPNEHYTDAGGNNVGHTAFHYSNWILNVVHRASPKPPKKRKPVLFHEISHEDLPAVLTGEQEVPDGHKVVLIPASTP